MGWAGELRDFGVVYNAAEGAKGKKKRSYNATPSDREPAVVEPAANAEPMTPVIRNDWENKGYSRGGMVQGRYSKGC